MSKYTREVDDVETNEDTIDIHAEMRFLSISWLDNFEKLLFEGKTIDELMHMERYEQQD